MTTLKQKIQARIDHLANVVTNQGNVTATIQEKLGRADKVIFTNDNNEIIHEMTFNYCPPLYDKIADHHFDVGYSTDFTQMYIERSLRCAN